MNIVLLTPGTGNFYCGNCLRDNALASELRAQGHTVHLIPLYLPHVVDEPSAADSPIFYGGISVYLEQKLALFRRTPRWLDRLLNNNRLLRWAADHSGMTSAHDLGALTLSMLRGEEGRQNKELSFLIDYLRTQGRIDVICLSNALLLGMARRLKAELNCPVVCTLAGEDGFLDALTPAFRDDCWNTLADRARDADGFIAVSRYYADVMTRRLAIDPARMHVVYNGINLSAYHPTPSHQGIDGGTSTAAAAPTASHSVAPPHPPVIGYLARMAPFKGLETLIDAFIILRTRNRIPDLQLRVAGAAVPADRPFIGKLQRKLRNSNLDHAASFHPNLDHAAKVGFLRSLSVLSVPATYGEAFGLYLLEAWAAAIPVVQPRHAAFIELIESIGGGILVEPDDPVALADGLELTLLRYDDSRQSALAAQRRVHSDFNVASMARNVMNVFNRVTARTPTAPHSDAPVKHPPTHSTLSSS